MPATIATGSPSWWSGFTAVSNATGAQVSKGVTASLLSSLGASNSLPATISTTVPRATLAASAAKIIRGASPAGLASMALFAALSTAISMNPDGTINQVNVPSSCAAYINGNFSGCTASSPCYCTVISAVQVNMYYQTGAYRGYFIAPFPWSNITETVTPSETDLSAKIQATSVPSHQLFVAEMNDILANKAGNIDFGTHVMPKAQPATVSASPVTGPAEVVATETTPNSDGSTTTTTRTAQTTATPSPRGSTVGDIGVDWKTATTMTSVAHNNATGAETTATSTTNDGTATTKAPSNFDCPSCAQETTLQSLKAGTANTLTPKTLKSFDNAVAEDAIADSKAAYDAKFQQVKTDLANLFSLTASANNELPEFDFGTIHGQHIQSSLNNHSTALSYVGMTLIFAATVFSIWLLLG
ncbi:hypothetical protein [Methylomonas koyamae]|uniref:hypothetical protein n=2 Tax=Methylomonas koyamae TaxID=702114 RepID=UPI001C7F96AC|nr:hypothetical protein [Methylomonas koyamae]